MSLLSALTLQTSGYLAEEYRGGIEGIDHGRTETGRFLGLSKRQVMRLVVTSLHLAEISRQVALGAPVTLVAALGLARDGTLALDQHGPQQPIQVADADRKESARAVATGEGLNVSAAADALT